MNESTQAPNVDVKETIHLTSLEAENCKRIQAVHCRLDETGMNIIGGNNGQGKTSFLDSVAWTLGGDKFKPTNADREGGEDHAHTRIELSNGLVAERKGKNGRLVVTDTDGKKGGQSILNEFIPLFALDLPDFLGKSDKQKARILLDIIGVEDELQKLEHKEKALYEERENQGRDAKKAKGYASELPFHEDAPKEAVTAQELIQKQQAILLRNAENQKARENVPEIETQIGQAQTNQQTAKERIEEKRTRIKELQAEIKELEDTETKQKQHETELTAQLQEAKKTAEQLQDESTAEIEAQIQAIEETNEQIRANKAKAEAEAKAARLEEQYSDLTDQIADVRKEIMSLLEGAQMPLPELTVRGGELRYQDQPWDCMADSDRLRVATAICRRLNPQCGFVLVDGLEKMDLDTLRAFAKWAQGENLQIIGTRVSVGDECSLIIEDGMVARANQQVDPEACPIPGKMFGLPWSEIDKEACEYALNNPEAVPQVTEAHREAIRARMAPASKA